MAEPFELRGVQLGDVYREHTGSLWEVIGLTDQPTAAFRRVGGQDQVAHVIGCANMRDQFPSGPLRPRDEALAALRALRDAVEPIGLPDDARRAEALHVAFDRANRVLRGSHG